MRGWVIALLVGLGTSGAAAQELATVTAPSDMESEDVRPSPAPMPLVLRPEPELARLARRAARLIARRSPIDVEVGEPPPPDILEAVPEGHLGMATGPDGELVLVLGVAEGGSFATELTLPARNTDARVRALVLAIESLRDAALDGPPPATAQAEVSRFRSSWVLLGGLPRGTPREPLAKPTIYLRFILGVSPLRGTPLVGPGMGLGLCVTAHCVVLEGDLPLVTEARSDPEDGTPVEYRAVNFSVRFQFRPVSFGDITPGITGGLMTRVGTARLAGADRGTTATSLGVRGTLEVGWRFAPRFEAVAEAGVDYSLNRAAFIRESGHEVFLEDRWNPWLVFSMRLRPDGGEVTQ